MLRKYSLDTSAILCCALIFLSACGSDKSVGPVPTIGVDITVDSAAYHLQQFFSSYYINVKSTIANHGDHDIFIARNCYDGQHVRRADAADNRELLLGMYGCIEEDRIPPVRVPAGTEFTETWKVDGSNSPETRPPITIDDNTGTLVMTYVLTDSAGEHPSTIVSPAFDVLPPIPPENRDTLKVTSGVGVRVTPDSVIASRAGEHLLALVRVRMYNGRKDDVGVNPCGWTLEHKNGDSWDIVDQAHCSQQIGDYVVAGGDSATFSISVDDSPITQTQFHREGLATGVYRMLMTTAVGGDRPSLESNTFALFVDGNYQLSVERAP